MIYERIAYMCPKCNKGYFFNNAEKFSTICPSCDVEMVFIAKRFISTEEEEENEAKWQRKLQHPVPMVYCPYCNSVNTKKISTTSKVVNAAIFGIWGTKRHKQWHCNHCNSDF